MNTLKRILLGTLVLTIGTNLWAKEKPSLLFYIGITMIKPVTKLVENYEKQCNCRIKILQGGSQDLYDSIKMSQKGDVYLPGSLSYRKKNMQDGILLEGKFVGYNKIALVVKKGNPKNIQADLTVLSKRDYRVAVGNAESGSIGNATKKVLEKFGNYEEVMMNAISLEPDSRNLTRALVEDRVDVIANWYATTFWESNKDNVEALVIDEKYAKKKKLVFNLLSTSKNKELSRGFMNYAASKEGRAIFHEYGFLDKSDLANFDKVTF